MYSHDTHEEEDEVSDDHQQDDGQEGQQVTSSSSLSKRGMKTKSIYEELRESNVSPKQKDKGKQSEGCRDAVKASITVNTPLYQP